MGTSQLPLPPPPMQLRTVAPRLAAASWIRPPVRPSAGHLPGARWPPPTVAAPCARRRCKPLCRPPPPGARVRRGGGHSGQKPMLLEGKVWRATLLQICVLTSVTKQKCMLGMQADTC
eukprot:354064-Chlamydomonas_euryale.AAC.7